MYLKTNTVRSILADILLRITFIFIMWLTKNNELIFCLHDSPRASHLALELSLAHLVHV